MILIKLLTKTMIMMMILTKNFENNSDCETLSRYIRLLEIDVFIAVGLMFVFEYCTSFTLY